MCFWEAQMPWRSPCNNNRDCSQLWMVLVDFSSNKNHESFHNFWNCKEITTLWLWEGEKDTLWSTKSSKLKCVPFFCLLRSCTSSIQLAMEKKLVSRHLAHHLYSRFCRIYDWHSTTFRPHFSRSFGPEMLFHVCSYILWKQGQKKEVHTMRHRTDLRTLSSILSQIHTCVHTLFHMCEPLFQLTVLFSWYQVSKWSLQKMRPLSVSSSPLDSLWGTWSLIKAEEVQVGSWYFFFPLVPEKCILPWRPQKPHARGWDSY